MVGSEVKVGPGIGTGFRSGAGTGFRFGTGTGFRFGTGLGAGSACAGSPRTTGTTIAQAAPAMAKATR
ncbi:hypothetical protein J2853_000837 [Streptosporangium lutulentum]|uniref:Uncharacterized protein n=1 Tax=Streptosporangium lutulentum TaxID=1461250 RepID=A0ABT9Q5F8_9ACTN|nr:hypothetical protein [Streptosporangium lutulentum]